MWVFHNCYLDRVIDGDTVSVNIDMGFGLWVKKMRFRLARINAPEIRGVEKPQGMASKLWVEGFLHEPFTLKSEKHGKYRWIAEIEVNGMNLSDELVKARHAVYKVY